MWSIYGGDQFTEFPKIWKRYSTFFSCVKAGQIGKQSICSVVGWYWEVLLYLVACYNVIDLTTEYIVL